MSLYGLIHPDRTKCESLNWRIVRGEQLQPNSGMTKERQCDYGAMAPYTSSRTVSMLERENPLRIMGYPYVTKCSTLSPLIYAPKTASRPQNEYGPQYPQWPYGFYCGKGTCQRRHPYSGTC